MPVSNSPVFYTFVKMKTAVEFPGPALNAELTHTGFRAYDVNICSSGKTSFGRRHFYKIVFSIGKGRISFADKSIDVDGPHLFFATPHMSYAVEFLSGRQTGYACIFNENFIKPLERAESFQQSPLFKSNGIPLFILDEQQQTKIAGIFKSIIAEQASDYLYKDDLIRNYMQLIIHEAMRMQPATQLTHLKSASLRITNLFLELLERQFPIESQQSPLTLRTAQDFAGRLSIHVNYLNRAVKQVTGKSTTTHIAERVIAEGMALLQHTDWGVAEIAYALGFEYPNYFSNFFKKMTGDMPKIYRVS
jgi:AraC family transcriptional regulator, transcriptional activator of pobA